MRPPAPPPRPRPAPPPRPARPPRPTEEGREEPRPGPGRPQPSRRPWGNLTAELGRFHGSVQDLERHLQARGFPLRANQTYASAARLIHDYLQRRRAAGSPAPPARRPAPTAGPDAGTWKRDSHRGIYGLSPEGVDGVAGPRHPKPEVLGSAADGSLLVSLDGLRGHFERVVLRWQPQPPAEGPRGELSVPGTARTVSLPRLLPGTTYHVEVHGVRAGQTSKSYAFITTTGSVGCPGPPGSPAFGAASLSPSCSLLGLYPHTLLPKPCLVQLLGSPTGKHSPPVSLKPPPPPGSWQTPKAKETQSSGSSRLGCQDCCSRRQTGRWVGGSEPEAPALAPAVRVSEDCAQWMLFSTFGLDLTGTHQGCWGMGGETLSAPSSPLLVSPQERCSRHPWLQGRVDLSPFLPLRAQMPAELTSHSQLFSGTSLLTPPPPFLPGFCCSTNGSHSHHLVGGLLWEGLGPVGLEVTGVLGEGCFAPFSFHLQTCLLR